MPLHVTAPSLPPPLATLLWPREVFAGGRSVHTHTYRHGGGGSCCGHNAVGARLVSSSSSAFGNESRGRTGG
eukprot:scaffold317012_cov30-Tisochrysis_lutea.AAC.1